MTLALAIACCGWLGLLLLPFQPWRCRERLDVLASDARNAGDTDLRKISVLIPARNEASSLKSVLDQLSVQGTFAKIVVVNDQSDDDTLAIARAFARDCTEQTVTIIDGVTPPPGESGKLWALRQGIRAIDSELILLLDADIALDPGVIHQLEEHRAAHDLDLASLMVELSMRGPWEKLLIPAFIYFFKLLYPFALANSNHRLVAAAAGGCILLKKETLNGIGGFESLQGALIDDCTLARKVKDAGGRTWLGLSRAARSARPYEGLGDIWNMVARTAFTQLHYSWLLLALCVALMSVFFVLPLIGVVAPTPPPNRLLALAALLLITASYLPVNRYYQLHPVWALTLPIAGILYMLMTLTSAYRYARGQRSMWKKRQYSS